MDLQVYIHIQPYFNERRYGKLAWRQNHTDDYLSQKYAVSRSNTIDFTPFEREFKARRYIDCTCVCFWRVFVQQVKEAFRSLLFVTSTGTCEGRQTGSKDLMKKLKSESMQKYGGMYWESEEVRINYYRSRVWLVCKNNNTTYEYTLLEQPTIAYFMYELVKLGGQILNAALEAGRDMFDGSIYTMADLFREKTFSVDGKTMRTGWQGQSSADRFLCQRLWCRWRNMDYGSYFTRKVPLQFASFSQRISL